MGNTLYTIGYSGFSIDDFVHTLREHEINALIDVRSTPFSQYFKDYDKPKLRNALKAHGIHYRNYHEEFGARRTDPYLFDQDGIVDFEKLSRLQIFRQGVETLTINMDREYIFCLMCAEKDPITCHRAILVARSFRNVGIPVVHLLPAGQTETQKELEERLLAMHFPNREQMSLFEDEEANGDLLNLAYRQQNKAIGYRLQKEQDTK